MFISATGSVLVVLWQETKVQFLIWRRNRNNSKRLIFSTHICTFISSMFEKNFIKFNSIFSARNQNFGKTNNFAFDTFESGFSKDLIWTRTGLTGMKKGVSVMSWDDLACDRFISFAARYKFIFSFCCFFLPMHHKTKN